MPRSDVTGSNAAPEASDQMSGKVPVLFERIAAAFGGAATIDQVKDLLAELTAAIAAAEQAAALAKARALDPTTMDVVTARRAQDDAAFTAERLRTALPKLQERLRELQAAAEDARRRAVYDQVKAERDELATELKQAYPAIVAPAGRAAGAHCRQRRAAGLHQQQRLAAAQLCRCNMPTRWRAASTAMGSRAPTWRRLSQRVRLPAFRPVSGADCAWPRASQPSSAPRAPRAA